MAKRGAIARQRRPARVAEVEFHRTKYGREILIDAAWVGEMSGFMRADPHVLSFYDILLVTRGRGWFWLDGHRHRVRPGQLLFTSPGQVRRWEARNLEGLCVFFPGQFLEEFFHDPMFLHRLPYLHAREERAALQLSPARAGEVRGLFLAMRQELRALRPDSPHFLRAKLYEALILLARRYAAAYRVEGERTLSPVPLRYREWLRAGRVPSHRVRDHARALGVSPSHLNALCKRYLGQSAKALLQDHLATEARRLLLYSGDSAARIGDALGFNDASYFARFFRRTTGQSPSGFRAAQKRRAGATAEHN